MVLYRVAYLCITALVEWDASNQGTNWTVRSNPKRAIHIILNFSRGMPYILMLTAANLTTLASRREEIFQKISLHITEPTSCLHHLLPEPREPSVISRLRTYQKYPRVYTRTAPLFTMRWIIIRIVYQIIKSCNYSFSNKSHTIILFYCLTFISV